MKTKNLNIAFGKIGATIWLKPEDWDINGGNPEPSQLLLNMAQLHPDWTFYLVGKAHGWNTWEHHNKFPNVIDIWESKKDKHWPTEYFKKNNIEIDFGLFYAGTIHGNPLTTNMVQQKNYAAPCIQFLNDSGIPYFLIGEDPTQLENLFEDCKDITNYPLITLSTTDYPEYKAIDAKHDLWFLANESEEDFIDFNMDELQYKSYWMNIFTNIKKGKLKKIYDYCWNNGYGNTFVYGSLYKPHNKTEEKIINEYGNLIIPKSIFNNNKLVRETKYTLMLAHTSGWRSASKFWKMILFGVIPIMLPGDDDNNAFELPDELFKILHVNNPAELSTLLTNFEITNELSQDEIFYHLAEMLLSKKDAWDGSFIDHQIIDNMRVLLNEEFEYGTGTITFKQSCLFPKPKIKSLF